VAANGGVGTHRPRVPVGAKSRRRSRTAIRDCVRSLLRLEQQPPAHPVPLLKLPHRTSITAAAFCYCAKRGAEELESTIGKLWLNRIGIFAI